MHYTYAVASAGARSTHQHFNAMLLARARRLAHVQHLSLFAIVRIVLVVMQRTNDHLFKNGIVCFIPALAPILGAWSSVEFGWRMSFLFLTCFALLGSVITFIDFQRNTPSRQRISWPYSRLRRFIPKSLAPLLFLFSNSLICMVAMSAILVFVTLAPGWLITKLGGSLGYFHLLVYSQCGTVALSRVLSRRFILSVNQSVPLR